MNRLLRRAGTTACATAAVVAVTAASASAHFCYKRDMAAQASARVADSQGFATLGSMIRMYTPVDCDAGVALLADELGAAPDTLINVRGTMAGGNVKQGKENPAIDHLDFPETEEEFEALIGRGLAACSG